MKTGHERLVLDRCKGTAVPPSCSKEAFYKSTVNSGLSPKIISAFFSKWSFFLLLVSSNQFTFTAFQLDAPVSPTLVCCPVPVSDRMDGDQLCGSWHHPWTHCSTPPVSAAITVSVIVLWLNILCSIYVSVCFYDICSIDATIWDALLTLEILISLLQLLVGVSFSLSL